MKCCLHCDDRYVTLEGGVLTQCYNCNKYGHYATTCTNPKQEENEQETLDSEQQEGGEGTSGGVEETEFGPQSTKANEGTLNVEQNTEHVYGATNGTAAANHTATPPKETGVVVNCMFALLTYMSLICHFMSTGNCILLYFTKGTMKEVCSFP